MSGGYAFVYDPDKKFAPNCNMEMVDIDPLIDTDFEILKNMLEQHAKYTRSSIAKRIIKNWKEEAFKFLKVFPIEFKRVLNQNLETQHTLKEVANG